MAANGSRSTERALSTCWSCGCAMRRDQRICGRCGATRVPTVRRPWLETDEAPGPAPQRARATVAFAPYPSYDDTAGTQENVLDPWGPGWQREPAAPDAALAPAAPVSSGAGVADYSGAVWAREAQGWQRRVGGHDRSSSRGNTVARRLADMLFMLTFGVAGGVIGGGIWYAIVSTVGIELGPCAVLMGFLIGKGVALGSARRNLVSTLLAILLTIAGWDVLAKILLAQHILFTPLDLTFLLASIAFAVAPTRLLPHRAS